MDSEKSKIKDINFFQQAEVLKAFADKTESKEKDILVSSLLFLAADIIKSDCEIKPIEIHRVNDLLCAILTDDEANAAFGVLQEFLNTKDSTYELSWQDNLINHCENLKETVPEEVLLHILAFLYDLIKIDNVVDACEMISLKGIAQLMGISFDDE